MGFEPMNTGFADQRVSHFAIGAHPAAPLELQNTRRCNFAYIYFGCAVVRRYGFTVL
jgi:hypothetical protein